MSDEPTVTAGMLLKAKPGELLPNLKKLVDELSECEQTEPSSGFLDTLAAALGSSKLVRHRDNDVKLLTACCLADVLRIYAPEHPYDNETLRSVYELFISQLRGLAEFDGASFARYSYLLERLSMVKVFVLMLDLNFDDMVRQLLEVVFESASEHHSVRVVSWMDNIITTTLMELGREEITAPLLDAILENLLPSKQDEKPASYNLARRVLENEGVLQVIQQPLQTFILGCLPTGSTEIAIESELKEDWPKLIFELAAVIPEILTFLVPQLQAVVQSDDEGNRLQGVELLAALFSLTGSTVVKHFPQLFATFIGKLVDCSVQVRTMMVEHAVKLMRLLPPVHADALAKALQERFYDPDESVRASVVKHVCEACKEGIGPFCSLVQEVGKRLNDKKPTVRSTARTNLCTLYRRNFSNSALSWIPQKLFWCYGSEGSSQNFSEVRELEALLDSTLLPQEGEERLRAICSIHATLLAPQRKALRSLLLQGKKAAQHEVQNWLDIQNKLKADPKSKDVKTRQAQLVAHMCKFMPEPTKAKEIWDNLAACKDKGVVKHLATLSSASSEYDEVRQADAALRKVMAQRLKPEQLTLLGTITARPAMWFMWHAGAASLLREVTEELGMEARGDEDVPVLSLLLDVALALPEVFQGGEALMEALQAAAAGSSRGALRQLLRIVHASNITLAQVSTATRKPLIQVLCQQCVGKDALTGKLAAQCLTTQLLVPAIRERQFTMLGQKLAAAVSDGSKGPKHQQCALSALGALAKRSPEALGDGAPQLLKQLKKTFEQRGGGQLKARCESQLLVCKLLANAAIGSSGAADYARTHAADGEVSSAESSQDHKQEGQRLAELMLKVLAKGGAVGAAADAGEDERASLRLAAACALLKLVRVRHMNVELYLMQEPERWHRLALCMQDEDSGVRKAFAQKMSKELQRVFDAGRTPGKAGAPAHYLQTRKNGLQAHFMSLFALAAVDVDKENVALARTCLHACASKFREYADRVKQANPRHAAKMCLEVQLPFLVHLLAHHPDLQLQLEEEPPLLLETQKCLDFFLGGVAAGREPHYELMRTQLNLVKIFPDKMAPEARETHVVADVARRLIAERTKGGWVTMVVPDGVGVTGALFGGSGDRFEDVDMLPRGFRLMDGLGRGGGAGGASKRPVAESSTPKKKKKRSTGAKPTGLPSPLPSAGSSRKKAKRKSSKKAKAASDEDDDDDDEEEEEAEGEEEQNEQEDDGSGEEGEEEDPEGDEEEGGMDVDDGMDVDESPAEEEDDDDEEEEEEEESPVPLQRTKAAKPRKAKTSGSENEGPQNQRRAAAPSKSKAAPAKAKGKPAAAAASRPVRRSGR